MRFHQSNTKEMNTSPMSQQTRLEAPTPYSQIIQLHRTLGNRAVMQLLSKERIQKNDSTSETSIQRAVKLGEQTFSNISQADAARDAYDSESDYPMNDEIFDNVLKKLIPATKEYNKEDLEKEIDMYEEDQEEDEGDLYETEDEGEWWEIQKDNVQKLYKGDSGAWLMSGVKNGSATAADGTFNYVKIGGDIYGIDYKLGGHYVAARGGKKVQYAGQIELAKGELVFWSNASGHYMPHRKHRKRMGLPDDLFKSYKEVNRK